MQPLKTRVLIVKIAAKYYRLGRLGAWQAEFKECQTEFKAKSGFYSLQ